MNSISLQEIELLYLFQDTATTRFKITEMHLICTINLQNFSRMLTLTSFTTLKLFLRLLSTKTQVELLEELKTRNMLKKSCNYKQLFNTNSRIFNTLELQCNNCQMIPQKPWFLKAAVSSRKKSLMKQKINSQKQLTSLDIPVISHTTFLFVTTR